MIADSIPTAYSQREELMVANGKLRLLLVGSGGLLIGAVAGVLGLWLVSRYVDLGLRTEEPPRVVLKEYLVAKADMRRGEKITNVEEHFRVHVFDPASAPPGAISKADYDAKPSDLLGKTLVQPLHKGEVMTEKHVRDDSGSIEPPRGFRAMAVPVRVNEAASLIQPGVHVDLICEFPEKDKNHRRLLQNIEVLAADLKPPHLTLTLRVKQKRAQAMALTLAAGGTLTPVLRQADEPLDVKMDEEIEIDLVLVAKQDLPAGTRLTDPEVQFKRVPYSRVNAPSRFITDITKVKDKVLKRAVAVNQPITESDLAEKEEK
jgi:Flp pilus assembly protein CpaB